MQKEKKKSGIIERVRKATHYSLEGLRVSFKEEQAFRLEVLIGVVLIPTAILIPVDLAIRILLVFSMVAVLVAELLNSAIEAVTDLVSGEMHHLAKKAKDCASAAVFLCLIGVGVMWIVALYQWVQSTA